MKRIALTIAVAVTLVGCIPYWTYLYYYPSGAFPEVRRPARCPDAPDTVVFSFGDVAAHVGARRSADGIAITLGFHVPERHTVRLLAEGLTIRFDDGEAHAVAVADITMKELRPLGRDGKLSYAPNQVIAPMARMIGASVRVSQISTRAIPRHFFTTAHLGAIEPERVHLLPVELEIDNQRNRLPAITFTRTRHHMIMASINC